jgi:N-methylhydantoinase A
MNNGRVDVAATIDRFHVAHEKRYTYRLPNAVQVVNFHLVARSPVPKPDLPRKVPTGRRAEEAILSRRKVDFDAHGIHEATIYDGLRLEPGMKLQGPAVVQESMVTLVVPPGNRVNVDEFGSYHVHLGQK